MSDKPTQESETHRHEVETRDHVLDFADDLDLVLVVERLELDLELGLLRLSRLGLLCNA